MAKILGALLVAALAMVSMACASQSNRGDKPAEPKVQAQPPFVGGKCTYQDYPGQALITSISPSPAAAKTTVYHVKFTFEPDSAIQQKWAHSAEKEYLITLESGRLPDDKYIEKNTILVGSSLPAVMAVITKGTCTPIIFQWPAIRQ